MSSLNTINVGGINFDVEDAASRTIIPMVAYKEDGITASQAYAVIGTPINWKGTLYYTKTAVAQGAVWEVGTNLTLATNLGNLMRNVNVYVGDDDNKIHFVDLTGADTALNFSSDVTMTITLTTSATIRNGDDNTYQVASPMTTTGKFVFVDSETCRVKDYVLSGTTVTHTDNTWTFTVTKSQNVTVYPGNGRTGGASSSGTVTLTIGP